MAWREWLDLGIGMLTEVALSRVILVIAVLGVPVLMFEMGYSHHRGNFHRWPMYIPVVLPPGFAASGFLLLMFQQAPWAIALFAIMSVSITAMGALGTFFHFQGVGRQTGGFNLDNLMVGPPAFAPLAFSILGVLGLVAAAYWNV